MFIILIIFKRLLFWIILLMFEWKDIVYIVVVLMLGGISLMVKE